MTRVDKALVEQLLENDALSFREIARQAGCSDWTVRAIARELAGDSRPMKTSYEATDQSPASGTGLVICAAILFGLPIALMVCLRRN